MDSFFGIGIGELFFIAILALIILGPERLPGAFREFAKYFRYVRNLSSELTSQFSEEMKGLEDLNPQNILKELTEDPAEKPKKKSGTSATKTKTPTKTSTSAKSSTAAKKTTTSKPAATGQKSSTTASTSKPNSSEPSADTQGPTVDAPVTETKVADATTEAVAAAGATADQQANAAGEVEPARDDLDVVDPGDMAKSVETLPASESSKATKDAASEQKLKDHQTPVVDSAIVGQTSEDKTIVGESVAQSDSSSAEADSDSDTLQESATGGSSITAERESNDETVAEVTKDSGQAANVHEESEPEPENRILPPQSAAQDVSSHESALADSTEQAGDDGTVPQRSDGEEMPAAAEDETVIEPTAATRRPVVNVNGKTADVEGEG